jgi:hypothetical protein
MSSIDQDIFRQGEKSKDEPSVNEQSNCHTIDESTTSPKEIRRDKEPSCKNSNYSSKNNREIKKISDDSLVTPKDGQIQNNIYPNEKLASENFGGAEFPQFPVFIDHEGKKIQPKRMAELIERVKTRNDSEIRPYQICTNFDQTPKTSKPFVCPLGVDGYGKILHVGPNAKEVFDQSDLKNQNIFELMASYNRAYFTRKFGKFPILGFKKPITVIRFSLNHEEDDIEISVIT